MDQAVLPVIPSNITVHLGAPDQNAENVTLPFAEYIKNVASGEIYPTWPENALRANIYAIISFALNRVYSEHYPSRGYDFDITSTTVYDQSFAKNRDIFENISRIVDEIFNNYIVKGESVSPYFTQFCNGTTSKCEGLSQWGTVDLANRGFTPLQILKYYYGDDIRIVANAPVQDIAESYPGTPLVIGDSGNAVKIIQTQLNRIAKNYPAIPVIEMPDGIFGIQTLEAVKAFQQIFSLAATGQVDKSTWYKIKRYYAGVKALSELVSEGITVEEVQLPYKNVLSFGDTGIGVQTVQYYLAVISYLNPAVQTPSVNGNFDEKTLQSVKSFQAFYGLSQTGRVEKNTYNTMKKIYTDTLVSLPPNYNGDNAKFYPGYLLSFGMQGEAVSDIQKYLSVIGRYYADLPEIPVTGYFGEQTQNAVNEFQRLFGIPVSGAVGAVTWGDIAKQYDFLVETEGARY